MNNHIIIKKIRTSVLWLCGILAPLPWGGVGVGSLSSCTDWDDHYEPSVDSGVGGTLWEQLTADPQLSDFCEVLEKTEIFRMHKKRGVSYADLLRGGQAFTVMAPVNGTFNKDSLLNLVQTAPGDSMVEKAFVFNHLSRMTTSLKATPQSLRMMNGKSLELTETTIQGIPVIKANQHAANGIIHVMSQSLPYGYNLYEALCDDHEVALAGACLRQYEWDEFDADASVISGYNEGVPVYEDSVVYERNRMLQSIGLLNAEDSTYWVVAPTAAGWERAWNNITQYFVYDESYQKRDSLQRFYTTRAIFDDAVFNMTDQLTTTDSLVSVPYQNWRKSYVAGKPVYHVFQKPFEPGGILNGARKLQCSNGVLYKTDEWPFDPVKTYFKELWTEAEATWLIIPPEKSCRYTGIRQVADSISENAFLQIVPSSGTANWELTFRIDNVLSGAYDVCVILLPQTVVNENARLRPCKFKAAINYVELDGKTNSFNCDNKVFQSNPEKVDTIVLAEAFRFPASNYGQSTNKINLTLKCNIGPLETSRFSREMLLDCIYLRPRTSNEE